MALDKLVDSTQLDADLTSVANAIRTKGGTSAQLAWPAGFVSAVEAIEAGGSFLYETGTFTLTASSKNKDLNHNLGVTPNFCFLFPIDIPKLDTHALYDIISQFFFREIGQADYNIANTDKISSDNHVFVVQRGQATTANNSMLTRYADNLPVNQYGNYYGGYFGETSVRVGADNAQGASGKLVAGTYGYILGVLPV